MKNNFVRICYLLGIALSFWAGEWNAGAAAKTWTGATDTGWNTAGNWSPSGAPVAADTLTLTNGNTRYPVITAGSAVGSTVAMGASGSGAAARIDISGGTLTLGSTMALSGTSVVSNSGGTILLTGALTVNSGTKFIQTGGSNSFTAASTITGTYDIAAGTTVSAGNFTIASGGVITNSGGIIWMAANTTTPPSDNIIVTGTLRQTGGTNAVKDLSGAGTMTVSGGRLVIEHDYKPTTPANFICTGGTVQFSGDAGNGSFGTPGIYQFNDVIIDSGVDPAFDNDPNTIAISGNYTNNGTPNFTGKATTVLFNGAGDQNIAGSSVSAFNSVSNANTSASVIARTNFSVAGTCTVTDGSTLQMGTQVMSGGGTFTLASGGTLGIGHSNGIVAAGTAAGNIQTTARNFSTDANYIYNGTAAQVTSNGLPTRIRSLKINNTSGTVTLSPVTTNATSVTLATGAKLSLPVGTSVASSFAVGGVGLAAGTWGSTSSAATRTNDTYFALTAGILNVLTDTRTAPLIASLPAPGTITFGQTLANSILTGGTATNAAGAIVAGSFAYTTPGIAPNAGTTNVSVTFTPSDTDVYLNAIGTVTVTVNQATPTATLTVNNSPTTYDGTGKSATVAISASSVPGTVANILTGGAASQTTAGSYAVTANFVPNDTVNYSTLTALPAGLFVIDQATPTATLTVNNSPTTYDGTGKSATVAISASSVPGTVANILTGGAASQTTAGSYAVTANFVPNDTVNYSTLTALPAGLFVIDRATTTSSVASSINPALPAVNVTFTKSLSVVAPGAGTPTGFVQFKTNGVAFGSPVALSGLIAVSAATSALAHGTNTVSAEYAGDNNFHGITNSLTPPLIVNTPPVARSNNTSVALGGVVTIPFNLGKYKLGTDADGDTLQISSAFGAVNGTIGVAANGMSMSYTNTGGTAGTFDTFNFVISDGLGGLSTNVIRVHLEAGVSFGFNQLMATSTNLIYLGIPGAILALENTATLAPPTWVSVSTNTVASDGRLIFNFGTPPSGFYRTRYISRP